MARRPATNKPRQDVRRPEQSFAPKTTFDPVPKFDVGLGLVQLELPASGVEETIEIGMFARIDLHETFENALRVRLLLHYPRQQAVAQIDVENSVLVIGLVVALERMRASREGPEKIQANGGKTKDLGGCGNDFGQGISHCRADLANEEIGFTRKFLQVGARLLTLGSDVIRDIAYFEWSAKNARRLCRRSLKGGAKTIATNQDADRTLGLFQNATQTPWEIKANGGTCNLLKLYVKLYQQYSKILIVWRARKSQDFNKSRIAFNSFRRASSTSGNASFSDSSLSSTTCETINRVVSLSSAGTTNHGASVVLVCARQSS